MVRAEETGPTLAGHSVWALASGSLGDAIRHACSPQLGIGMNMAGGVWYSVVKYAEKLRKKGMGQPLLPVTGENASGVQQLPKPALGGPARGG